MELGRLARKTRNRIRSAARTTTAPLRMLPSLIVIGGQKCGTTSLYRYLLQNRDIVPPVKKEPGFFDRRWSRGVSWYRENFPLRLPNPNAITLEASTGYISYPHAPPRVAEALPDVKLVALLRNPIDRAWSHYHHTVRLGHEPLPFGRALRAEGERLGAYFAQVEDEPVYDSTRNWYAYLARGRYADQLETWREHVAADRLLVLSTDELAQRPQATMDRVFAFAEVPAADDLRFETHNRGTNYKQPMDPATRSWLQEYFRPHNKRLYALLGRDFGWR